MDVEAFLAERVGGLRKLRGLSLDALADRSGVSRSTISLIERAETSATASVLNRLADALGVTLAALFADGSEPRPSPLSRPSDQKEWTDPASGYVRRHLSPGGIAAPLDLIEVQFPAGQTAAFETGERRVAGHQQVWMLEGNMHVSVNGESFSLCAGDCLAMDLGHQIIFHNPTGQQARYLIALTTGLGKRRRPS